MKKLTITILVIIAVSLFGFNYVTNFAFAQDAAPDTCLTGMRKYFDGEDGKSGANKLFRDDIENHFKNKASNSSLLGTAVQRYEKYKNDAATAYSAFSPQNNNNQTSEYFAQNQCYYEMQKQIKDARKIIMNDIEITSYKKKQTILIEKYESISSKLRKLNMSFAELQAFFQTFKDKMPGFIKTCL